jgi:hypothetical protein
VSRMAGFKCQGCGVEIRVEGLADTRYGHKVFCVRCGQVTSTN